jgi:hypothetical protein
MKKSILIPIFYLISLVAFGQSNPQSIQIKKEGFIAYKVEVVEYDSLINKTRSQAGVGKLERKSELDAYCYERCIRLMNIFLSNPEAYVLDYHQNNIFHKEAHAGYGKMENAFHWLNWKVTKAGLQIDKEYNVSPGHYKNRVNLKWKNYGTCSIVVEFNAINEYYKPGIDPPSRRYIPRKLLISYESFE